MPAYSKDGVSFLLYGTDALANAHAFQRHLVTPIPDAKPRKNATAGDAGLRFTKFFGRWASDARPTNLEHKEKFVLLEDVYDEARQAWSGRTDPLLDWLDPHTAPGTRPKGTVTDLVVGDGDRLSEANARQKALAEALGGRYFPLDLESRLLTGIGLGHPKENGFLFHPTLAVPYLRGTALKQVARDWAEEIETDTINRLFGAVDDRGNPAGAGTVAFLDALPLKPVTLTAEQITPHYGDYYGHSPLDTPARTDKQRPADWHDPVPVTLLAVEADQATRLPFGFTLLPLVRGDARPSVEDLDSVQDWLTDGLKWNGVGAKTTLGYGRFISAADAPLAVGDHARINDGKYAGRTGVIAETATAPSGQVFARITQNDGRGKIKGTTALTDLRRISEDDP